jgi:hypothetical protein
VADITSHSRSAVKNRKRPVKTLLDGLAYAGVGGSVTTDFGPRGATGEVAPLRCRRGAAMDERQMPRRLAFLFALSVTLVIGAVIIPASSRHAPLELSGLVVLCAMAAAALW